MKKENYLLAVSYNFNSIPMNLFGVSSWRDFLQKEFLTKLCLKNASALALFAYLH